MTTAIQFLESMGRNPAMGGFDATAYAAAVAGLQVDSLQRDALLERNPEALGALLGARPVMICSQYSPMREDESEELPDDGQDDAPDAPGKSDPDDVGRGKPLPPRK